MINFRVNRMPSMENFSEFTGFARRPMAPSKVPAGQIYLQKPGRGMLCLSPYHSGMAAAKTARRMYFSQLRTRVMRDFLIFGVGILCSSS